MSTDYRALCAELIKAVLADNSRLDILHIARGARAADLLERLAAPAPPAAGEVERAVADLRECADLLSWLPADGAEPMRRAADLLERQAAPVPVAERLQQLEDLAADAVSGLRYIEQTHGRLYGVGWDRVYEKADRLQPGHALPLPSGEVQP